MTPRWRAFPHPEPAYDYAGTRLADHWARLHQGDREPFPDRAWVERTTLEHPAAASDLAPARAAETLQDAWRAYHRGDFARAVELGLSVGPLGSNVADKATNIQATHLAAEGEELSLFQQAAERAEALQRIVPDLANAWYFHAQALGRYGQGISIARALAQGIGGRVKHSLERALAIDPLHGEAHIALGAYHAAVVHQLGSLVAGMTYGARKEAAIEHFERALQLIPYSAVARIEYAEGLVLLFGKARLDQANRLYEEAAGCEPLDSPTDQRGRGSLGHGSIRTR
jgi:tetratricopeptide (TPR) repeat protein